MLRLEMGSSKPEWRTPEMLKLYHGDNPHDQELIKKGFIYFNKNYQ